MNIKPVKDTLSTNQFRDAELGEKPVGQLLLKYSVPAIVSMIADSLYKFVDAIFIGRGINAYALGALSVTFPVTLIILACSLMIGIGAASVISRSLGAENRAKAGQVTGNAIVMTVALSLVVSLAGLMFLPQLLNIFGATPRVYTYAFNYLWVMFLGAPIYIMANVLVHLIRAEGNPHLPMIIVLAGTGLNLLLDPLFIFVFGWGMHGAAFATIIGAGVSVVIGLLYYANRKSALVISRTSFQINVKLVGEIVVIGFSSFARLMMASLVGFLVNNAIKQYGGPLHLSVLSMSYRLMILAFFPIYGISQGMQPIVGYNYGKKNFVRTRKAVGLSVASTTIIATFIYILMLIFTKELLNIFNRDLSVGIQGVPILRTLILLFPLAGFQSVGSSLFQALGKAFSAFILNISSQLFFVPIVLVLPLFMGINGIWFSYPASALGSFLLIYIRVMVEARRVRREEFGSAAIAG